MPSTPRGPHAGPTILVLILAVAAMIVELTTHICAGAFFDPLPSPAAITAYAFLIVTIACNARLLWYGDSDFTERQEHFWLGVAVVASGAALCIATIYTLMFLPILPVSVLGLLAMGIGACAWSPLFCLVLLVFQFIALLQRWEGRFAYPSLRLKLGAAAAAIAVFTILVGHPVAVGYYYQKALTSEPREPSLAALRRLGGAHLVHNLGYEEKVPVWVSVGQSLAGSVETRPYAFSDDLFELDPIGNDRAAARKLYVLLTGQSFESAPWGPPPTTGLAWDRSDPVMEEQGGEAVGHAVAGVSLATSRIDGVIDRETETAYQEWTMEFRNAGQVDAEARAEVLLPEGGVISKVSLWINGEERPAAFGPRSVVRQAYQDVAVAQRRDPLLVTAKRPDRAMVQCFPIPPRKTMKIRLGFTSPLVWRNPSEPTLQFDLPSLQQVNFRLPKELHHEVWIEGKWRPDLGRFAGEGWALSNSGTTQTARRSLPSSTILSPPSLRLIGTPAPQTGDRLGTALIRSDSPFPSAAGPLDLFVILDTSAGMGERYKAGTLERLFTAISALPVGSQVSFLDGRETEATGTPEMSAWVAAGRVRTLTGWLNRRRYEGGTAPAPAVRWAWEQALSRAQASAVLWLHGAVSADVVDATSLQQSLERRPDGPPLVSVQLAPGQDALLDGVAGSPQVHSLFDRPDTNSVAEGVRLAATTTKASLNADGRIPLGGRSPGLNGVTIVNVDAARGFAKPLAIAGEVLRTWYFDQRQPKSVKAAQTLAIRSRVVTPLSGAVVLETKEQYDRYNLSDHAEEGTIPSVPEPGTLALLALAGGACAWAKRKRRSGQDTREIGEDGE